jgi:hypothetical protein
MHWQKMQDVQQDAGHHGKATEGVAHGDSEAPKVLAGVLDQGGNILLRRGDCKAKKNPPWNGLQAYKLELE